MLVFAEGNSGFILKSPHDGVLWYGVANLYKCCYWGFLIISDNLAIKTVL